MFLFNINIINLLLRGRNSFFISLKKNMFKTLAQINKVIFPSFTKQRLNLAKAKKWQMVIIGFRYYVTTRALG